MKNTKRKKHRDLFGWNGNFFSSCAAVFIHNNTNHTSLYTHCSLVAVFLICFCCCIFLNSSLESISCILNTQKLLNIYIWIYVFIWKLKLILINSSVFGLLFLPPTLPIWLFNIHCDLTNRLTSPNESRNFSFVLQCLKFSLNKEN